MDETRSETLTYTYDELDRLDTVGGPYSQNYDYNSIGNITKKNTTSYTYGSAAHKHAVTSLSTGGSYTYDLNGNMITRVENGSTYTQTFDAENRLISVTISGQTTQFVYDGDGNLVKKIQPNGSRTLYVGGIYEVEKDSSGNVTKTTTYYPIAGAMRIKTNTSNNVYYVLKDHLGSASVVTDANGQKISNGEQRYYPFGEARLTPSNMLTDKLFTGQREMAGLGIYHYGARFYSPKLGRFLSADTIVPGYANPQRLNRYSYGLNNPSRYTDPTGHVACRTQEECQDMGTTPGSGLKIKKHLLVFKKDRGENWTAAEQNVLNAGAQAIANALAGAMNQENWLSWKTGEAESYSRIDSTTAFYRTFGGPITAKRVASNDCNCWARNMGNNVINFYNTISTAQVISHPLLIVHEIGHTFDATTGKNASSGIPTHLWRPIKSEGIVGTQDNQNFGYAGPHFDWQFGKDIKNRPGEEFADMFVGWVYNQWGNPDPITGINEKQNFMNALMTDFIP